MRRGKKYNPNNAEAVFKRLYGVKLDIFEKMTEIIQGKKRHTLKTQVIVEGKKGKIIDIREGKGCEHNFSLYKSTIGNEL